MQQKSQNYKIKGMKVDDSYSSFNPEYSWNNKNIRLTARDGNDLLSITNEKGNKNVSLVLQGLCLGTCVIADTLVVFTHEENGTDRIYKVTHSELLDEYTSVILCEKRLNFNTDNKIQTLPFYENESVQKVYWIDGLNQPRVINIQDTTIDYNELSFDFIQRLELNEEVSVTKQYGGGSFKSGVIQYAFTYFNKNGAESNIFHITPLNYISPIDRGGKVDELINNTFKIELTNYESKYEYVRIYSIYKTSLDTTPEVRNLIDLSLPEQRVYNPDGPNITPRPDDPIVFIDNGLYGSIVSSDLLLYIGGEEIIPGCMSQKNNTLFLGNIQTINNVATEASLNNIVGDSSSSFQWIESDEEIFESISDTSGPSYPYLPKSLAGNTLLRHFKFDETYRFGIQGQYSTGKWSSPIWIGNDKTVDLRYQSRFDGNSSVFIKKVLGKFTISNELFAEINILEYGFINVRPVMVPLLNSDRTVIAQGIVNNTISSMENRYEDKIQSSKFSYPDYFFRTDNKRSYLSGRYFDGRYSHFDLLKLNNHLNGLATSPNSYIENMGNWDSVDYHDIYDNAGTPNPLNNNFDRNFMFVDKNMVNFWSPEIAYGLEDSKNFISKSKKIGLYGFAFPTGLNDKLSIDSGVDIDIKSSNRNISNYDNSTLSSGWNYAKRIWTEVTDYDGTLSVSFPLWTPSRYIDPDIDIQFTSINKSKHEYFGFNSNLKHGVDVFRYELDINNPSVIYNDSDLYYRSNVEDNPLNSGNVLYSKSVYKAYPSNKFKNVVNLGTELRLTTDFIKSGLELKYNTAPHALFSFKKNSENFSTIPRLENPIDVNNGIISPEIFPTPFYRDSVADTYSCDIIESINFYNPIQSYNSSPIFDLYSDVISDPSNQDYSKYGGKSLDALYNNNWIPCGKAVKFNPGAELLFTDGDTYIQRFDLLRVFPDDLTQINQHTEIISFICESFINLDGRSDVNRYNTESSLMTPTNYGLLNNIYSQKNNYFNYNILDPLLFNTTKFNNSIVWTKTKVAGAINDNWTNISMLSIIDLDGVYGEVSSINLFNNDLYAFQQKGIAKLLFNERVQQQASDGISVELTNGYKVPEYRYITNQYGCGDKWSITEGKQGIYFVDYINKSLISIGDGIKDLGLTLGFKSWFNNVKASDKYLLSYDRNNNDLYIHNDINCLGYSEILQSFVSFYDYVGVPQMKNVWDNFISISYSDVQLNAIELMSENGDYLNGQDDTQLVNQTSVLNQTKIWLHNKGEYNKFYDVQQPFSVEYLFNPDPLNDKTFNTFEYRLNDQFIDWNHLEVTNWYQYGELNDRQYLNSLKRKFNVNRVQLPRQSKTLDSNSKLIDLDTRNSLNRIRSTWAKLKLEHQNTDVNNNRKFDMQDLTITYTV